MTGDAGGGMDPLIAILSITTLLGAALVGGIFFAFSSFVMQALARRPVAEAMAAMQSINVVVLNPSFLGAFLGTALLSIAMLGIAYLHWGRPTATYFLAAALLYLLGTFLVTGLGNVPLNDQLAAVGVDAPGAEELWQHYLNRWTLWNHVRTAAALAAALMHSLGLLTLCKM